MAWETEEEKTGKADAGNVCWKTSASGRAATGELRVKC